MKTLSELSNFLNSLISEEPKIGKIKIHLHESGNSVTIDFVYDKNEIINLIEKENNKKLLNEIYYGKEK